jgi:hypothetical protein
MVKINAACGPIKMHERDQEAEDYQSEVCLKYTGPLSAENKDLLLEGLPSDQGSDYDDLDVDVSDEYDGEGDDDDVGKGEEEDDLEAGEDSEEDRGKDEDEDEGEGEDGDENGLCWVDASGGLREQCGLDGFCVDELDQ